MLSRFVRDKLFAAAVVSACLSSTAMAQTQPVRVAIIGLEHGHVGGFLHAFPRQNDTELVGIVDPHPELRARYEQQFHLDHSLFYSTIDELLAHQHPQALLVYTSIAEHRPIIEQAAAHGLDVMVEKPLTLSLDDALAIRRVAREHHIRVLVNYETTWYASNRAAFEALQNGSLGPARRIVVHDGHQGPREIGVPPEFLSWLTDPAQNGAGALYDFGCYGVDLATWLMHGETPQTVTAVVNHDKPEIYSRVDDDSTIVLQYRQAQAVIQGSWNWPFSRKDMEVYGARGYVITVGPDKLRTRIGTETDEKLAAAPSLNSPENDSLSYLSAVLQKQIRPRGDLSALDTNVIVMQILDAARESARTGRSVRLNPLGAD